MALSMDTVVIAEDNPDISEMIKEYFEQVYNLTVKTTDKVDKILPLVLISKASVLIMDLELKDGDASQVLNDVAAIPGLIVIIFTGTWRGRQENELLENGAQVVMRKPQKPATIWQQVLNLRGIQVQQRKKLQKIRTQDACVVFDLLDGSLRKEGGKSIFLDDVKKGILVLLSRGLEEYQNLPNHLKGEKKESTGWTDKKTIIKTVFSCNDSEVGNYKEVITYHLRTLNKTLGEFIDCEKQEEFIENKRVGRYKSYYRLNQDVFEVSEAIKESTEEYYA